MFDFKGLINALLRRGGEDPLGNLKSATMWVRELPDSDFQEAVDEIIKAVVGLSQSKHSPLRERIQVLLYLDEKAIALQETLCHQYLHHLDESDAAERMYLQTILSFWEEMAEAYHNCIREFAQNPAGRKIWEVLPLLTARAIRYYAMQVKWNYLRYLPVETHVWRYLSRLYLFAEREDFACKPLTLYPGQPEETTCAAEYIHPYLLQLANPESLRPPVIQMLDMWLDGWSKAVLIEKDFRPQRQTYAINLSDGKPAKKLRRNMIGEKYRYWGVDGLLITIDQIVEQLKNGAMPARLRLGEDCRLPACLELINLVSHRWAGNGPTRQHERQENPQPVEVAQGLSEIVARMHPDNGLQQPKAKRDEPSEADREIAAYRLTSLDSGTTQDESREEIEDEDELFDLADGQWLLENESISGYGAAFEANGKRSPQIGTLIGLRPVQKRHYAIGVIRRICREPSNLIHVGIQTLTQTPILVKLRTGRSTSAFSDIIDAVYLPSAPGDGTLRSLLIPAKAYSRGRLLELQAQGKSYSIRLQRILEQTEDYARAHFDVLAKH